MSRYCGQYLTKSLLTAACVAVAWGHTAYASGFKTLPHDLRACVPGDLEGLYKLRDVMEKPKPGPATVAFENAPHQYLFFRKTQSYVEVSGSLNYIDAKMMDTELQKRFKQDKRQYVLTESGDLYFYKGGKPIETYDCEIVNKAEPPFDQGEMLLIMPAPDILTVKIYRRYSFQAVQFTPPPPAPPPPAPPPPAQRAFVPRGR